MPTIECNVAAARNRLEAAGVSIDSGNTDYELWRTVHGAATAVAYEGKIVVQGSSTAELEGIVREARGSVEAYFAGLGRGNPGPAAIGWVLVTDDGIFAENGETIGNETNELAEYEAMTKILETADAYGFDRIDLCGESTFVIDHIRGEIHETSPDLRERRIAVRELLETFDQWSFVAGSDEMNERAETLAKEAPSGEVSNDG